MLAIFEQLKLPVQSNLHLMFFIEEYARDKHTNGLWNFRQREDSII